MNKSRYDTLTIKYALEFSSVFQGCSRISTKKLLQGLSRDRVALIAATLNHRYCNKPAMNIIHMLNSNDKNWEKLYNRVYREVKKKYRTGVELVAAFDIMPLELLRFAFSIDPKKMEDVPEELVDQVQFALVKCVMQINEDLMRYSLDKKDEKNAAKIIMVNSASYNDVLKESNDAYLYQVAQSFLFFKWIEQIPKYERLLQAFNNHFGIQSWKEYVRTVYGLALMSFEKDTGVLPKTIEYDPPGLLSLSVLDKLSIDCNSEVFPYSAKDEFDRDGNSDYRHFKARPLLKLSNGDYVVHNAKILIDRLYSSLYFDFHELADSMEGKHPDVSNLFTELFVEKIMFGSYLADSLKAGVYEAYDEKRLKGIYKIKEGEPGCPDYYLYNKARNSAIIFECKDIRLNSWVKGKRDYSLLEEEIRNKIVVKTYQQDQKNHCRKNVEPTRIGVGQIAAHVANIRQGAFPWDKELPTDCNVYPVLVIADNRLIFDGLPYLTKQWYEERLEEEGAKLNASRPLIMMSPLTLLKYRPLFLKNGLEHYFEAYYASLKINSHRGAVDIINRVISFDSYMDQFGYSLGELWQEIIGTLFNKEDLEAVNLV